MTFTNNSIAASLSLVILSIAQPVLATTDVDIFATSSGGQLTTGGWDDESRSLVADSQRVFWASVGEDPEFPFGTYEPGIVSDLTGASISLNLMSGLGAWSGAGFDPAPSTWLTAAHGPQGASTLSGGGLSFLMDGDFHVHLDWLFGDVPDSDPTPGIYLASFTLSGSGYETSETFWIVFNVGLSDDEHDAAIDWTEDNLVPAPGVLAVFTAAFAANSRKWYSRRRADS